MNIKNYLETYRDYLVDRVYLDSDIKNSRTNDLVLQKHTENLLDEVITSLNLLLVSKQNGIQEITDIFDNLYEKIDYLKINSNALLKINESETLPDRLESFKLLKPVSIKNFNKLLGGLSLTQKSKHMYVAANNIETVANINTQTFYLVRTIPNDVYEFILNNEYTLKEVLFFDKKNQLLNSNTKLTSNIPINCAKIVLKTVSNGTLTANPVLNVYSLTYAEKTRIQLNKNVLDTAKYLTIATDSFVPNNCNATLKIHGTYLKDNQIIGTFKIQLGLNSMYATIYGSELSSIVGNIYNLKDEVINESTLTANTLYKVLNNAVGCKYLGSNVFELADIGSDTIELNCYLDLNTTDEKETPLITSIIGYTHND